MIELSRNLTFDKHLGKWTLDMLVDGENETMVFRDKVAADKEYKKLRADGAGLMPLELDGAL